jgi:hypothetical protein
MVGHFPDTFLLTLTYANAQPGILVVDTTQCGMARTLFLSNSYDGGRHQRQLLSRRASREEETLLETLLLMGFLSFRGVPWPQSQPN